MIWRIHLSLKSTDSLHYAFIEFETDAEVPSYLSYSFKRTEDCRRFSNPWWSRSWRCYQIGKKSPKSHIRTLNTKRKRQRYCKIQRNKTCDLRREIRVSTSRSSSVVIGLSWQTKRTFFSGLASLCGKSPKIVKISKIMCQKISKYKNNIII